MNLRTLSGCSPLVIAAANGFEKSVKRLIRSGAMLTKEKEEVEQSQKLKNAKAYKISHSYDDSFSDEEQSH